MKFLASPIFADLRRTHRDEIVVDLDFNMYDLVEISLKSMFVVLEMIGLRLALKRPVCLDENKSVYDIVEFMES